MRWRCVTISHYCESGGCDEEWTTLLIDFISFTLPLKAIIILLGSLSGRISYGKKLREETDTVCCISEGQHHAVEGAQHQSKAENPPVRGSYSCSTELYEVVGLILP